MKTNTAEKIIDFLKKNGQARPVEIFGYLGISYQAVLKQLSGLIEKGQIKKIGKPPMVFYSLFLPAEMTKQVLISDKDRDIIAKNFFIVTPSGEINEGVKGFVSWCEKRGIEVSKAATDYIKIVEKYNNYKKDGLIDGLEKMKSTFSKVYLDSLYYIDFYSIERFGKTKLGQMLLYAKNSQDRVLIKKIAEEIRPKIIKVIKDFKIDAVGFIPPTVKRQVQFMKELEKYLDINIPKISLVKIKTEVSVPQKSLNKLEDRIQNAASTIIVNERGTYNNILLVDDAVGSGATLNETARQIKEKKVCKDKLVGISITGSFKGFDVISEV
ncbi:MAG: hypothetical protein WC998_04130 [Candidatus Paceibacterota bacterium]|jgi:hypoxanthine-guanine phosphoribosyltransferase